ncbi:LacI family transcriptional regulator [Agromyces rhizosphaerae]|uniref:LacI family transcriptional regulator n=1 Tax=Agromyces rhizosphaerae TaxID=88374 RepID=A0A9W6CXE2_9MICO|nr:LacI family DNA-binding transcriptional regulator [Agromyces rhizosphaerae]GLI27771.1 LacI family transcriptional regulator [Agromyces rhizosphaerae]
MATYKDIRDETGLSLATISKFYNGGNVLPANARAIEAAAERLSFRPNAFARNLRSRRTRSVGVLLPDLTSDFHLSILAGIERRLRDHRVSMLICADHPHEEGLDEAVEFLAARMVDGIIAVPTERATPGLRNVAAQGMPIVTMDWPADGVVADEVVIDNEEAAAMAIQHLADHGHRRIALLGSDLAATLRSRERGVRRQLAARGIPVREEYISRTPMTVAAGRAAMQRMLLLEERPTAVFCTNNMLGVGALTALAESGLKVPDEMSFVGFDMPLLARMTSPSLAMVAQRVDLIAREAADLMLRRLEPEVAQSPQRKVVLHAEFLFGGSVADIRS